LIPLERKYERCSRNAPQAAKEKICTHKECSQPLLQRKIIEKVANAAEFCEYRELHSYVLDAVDKPSCCETHRVNELELGNQMSRREGIKVTEPIRMEAVETRQAFSFAAKHNL
jgi:hypothetical protein